jgi:hypothetical protein
MNRKTKKLFQFDIFDNLSMVNIRFGAEAFGAGSGTASHCGSGAATLVLAYTHTMKYGVQSLLCII